MSDPTAPVTRWRVDVEYDGSGFAGWQLQPGQRTIQGELEAAIPKLVGHAARVHGAGRTDAGVHALQQVAMFETTTPRPARAIRDGLNAHLPHDVSVVAAAVAADDFHPRHSPHQKTYIYRWLTRPSRPVWWRGRCWHLRAELDVDAMQQAVDALVGTHDFSSFRAAGCSAPHAVRTLEGATVVRDGDLVQLQVVGTGFLRHMVRILSGSLVRVGRKRQPPEWLVGVLAARDRRAAGETAPPEGLLLASIRYGVGAAVDRQPTH